MAKKKLQFSDISVVIPTYNRSEELLITLKALFSLKNKPYEIVVVDQSKDDLTKKMIESLKSKQVRYIYSNIPAITKSRNIGAKASSKNTKIVCFIDDDVTLYEGYFAALLDVYNKNETVRAVAGFVPFETNIKEESKFDSILRRIFMLGGRWNRNYSKILSAYGNVYPRKLSSSGLAQWFPGDNMSYRKEVFLEQIFDENLLGYTVAEDIDFNYRLFLRHKNSLIITPYAPLTHRYSPRARQDFRRMAYINQVDHFYFNFKNLNRTFTQKLIFFWTLFGISILRMLNFAHSPKKTAALKLVYFFESIFYCITNLNRIRQGKVRDFENVLSKNL